MGIGRSIWLTATAALVASAAAAQDTSVQPEATTALAERQSVRAQEFMLATANPQATQAGYDVLAAGGSAADAAVAVQVMLNLVEPQSSGLGGGAFLLYWDAGLGLLTTLDARERAPMSADDTYWLGEDGQPMEFSDAVPGGRSVGVPGTPMLLERMHEMWGRTPWAELIQPTIDMAEQGFEISPRLASALPEAERLAEFPEARAYFFTEDGSPKSAGTLLANPEFARTLRLYASEGAQPFYTGAIARDIVAAVATPTNPGMLTLEDFAAYEVKERPPVCIDYRAWEVCGMGPPSSGALTVGQTLGMLESFDLGAMGPGTEATHVFVEALKLAFADRGLYMADSDYVDMPEGLLDRDYLASRAKLIDEGAAMDEAAPGEPPWDDAQLRGPDTPRPRHGTSHFVIVDRYGDMVSMTTTIESGFGSHVMTGGYLLNNELTDFSFAPDEDGKPVANRVEGGKRPRSSMAPTVVLQDGEPVLLTGSPGGSRIIPYVAQSLVSILDWDMDPQEAIDMPHVLSRNGPTDIEEGESAEATAEALAALGHETNIRDLNSGLHVILITEDGTLIGAADKRREGAVMGD